MVNENSGFRLIDIFSGCGGMTWGFSGNDKKYFYPVWAIDSDQSAIDSYRANFDKKGTHSILGDIKDILENKKIEVPLTDVLVGGPPCQGFSLLNKCRGNDQRRELWRYFIETAVRSEAKVVVMENVRQLFSSSEFQEIVTVLKNSGFDHLEADVLHAADYGVPQSRHRTFLMASRVGPISLPRPTHSKLGEGQLDKWRTVKDAIGDLSDPCGTKIRYDLDDSDPMRLHFGRCPTPKSLERYAAVPAGGNRFDLQKNRPDITPNCWIKKKTGGTDLFGRLWWERPSVTIRTEFFKPEKGRYLHPSAMRPITHREGSRLQSFPDDFKFRGSKIAIARQIGNAVPPLLAIAIAKEVKLCLENQTSEEYVRETNKIYKKNRSKKSKPKSSKRSKSKQLNLSLLNT